MRYVVIWILFISNIYAADINKKISECKNDNSDSCFQVGNLYCSFFESNSSIVDEEKAVVFFRKGCKLGNSKSCNNLATHYSKGCGLEQDTEEALVLYERAIELFKDEDKDYEEIVYTNLENLIKYMEGL